MGKTTLLAQLLPFFGDVLPGVTTWAVPRDGVYFKENRTGATARIGSFDPCAVGRKMRPVEEGFLDLGVPALARCMETDGEWAAVDEIGFLETGVPAYREALERLLAAKRVLAVVRKDEDGFLQALLGRADAYVLDLDAPIPPLGCVIMASGLGRRFGANKLLAGFAGRPLIEHILDTTEDIFTHRVVVTRHEAVKALCVSRGIPAVLHALPHRSDTIRLGLEALPGGLAGCLFCTGDQPLVTRDSVLALALSAAQEPGAIWRLAFGDTAGSPVLFPRGDFEELRRLPQGKGGTVILRRDPGRVRLLQAENEAELADIDCPQDLEKLEELLKRRTI